VGNVALPEIVRECQLKIVFHWTCSGAALKEYLRILKDTVEYVLEEHISTLRFI